MSEDKSWKKEKKQEKTEMSLEEAKAYRASLHKEKPKELTSDEKKEQFRLFWAQNKNKYQKAVGLEEIVWLHLKSIKLDSPEQFEDGLKNFGLKKIK